MPRAVTPLHFILALEFQTWNVCHRTRSAHVTTFENGMTFRQSIVYSQNNGQATFTLFLNYERFRSLAGESGTNASEYIFISLYFNFRMVLQSALHSFLLFQFSYTFKLRIQSLDRQPHP